MSGRQPSTPCPLCARELDAWTASDGGEGPSPGDASLCAYCHVLLVYNDDLTLRLPTREEAEEIAHDMGWRVP